MNEAHTPWHINDLNGRLPTPIRRKMPDGEADTFYATIAAGNEQIVTLDFGYGSKRDADIANLIVTAVNSHAALLAACKAVIGWYDRDGSVGGIVDPMDQLRTAIHSAEPAVTE